MLNQLIQENSIVLKKVTKLATKTESSIQRRSNYVPVTQSDKLKYLENVVNRHSIGPCYGCNFVNIIDLTHFKIPKR